MRIIILCFFILSCNLGGIPKLSMIQFNTHPFQYIHEGQWQDWHKNGELAHECIYRENRPAGIWKSWYSNGKIFSEISWENTPEHLFGKYVSFDLNGKIVEEGVLNKIPDPIIASTIGTDSGTVFWVGTWYPDDIIIRWPCLPEKLRPSEGKQHALSPRKISSE